MSAKILFVDDEPNVLAGFERIFRREFSVETANGGAAALEKISMSGPYAVIISDMRMPAMSGSELLARARAMAPDSIRMVLTGETDINSAMQAVNDGAIFRFLLKPCREPVLRAAIEAGLRQYELQHIERDLLEKTLNGSIKVLTEVLSLVNPAAFGRSTRIRRYVRHIVRVLQLTDAWQFEIAAMLSQIGCVTLPPATLDSVYAGQKLSGEDHGRFMIHPSVAHDLIVQVPRLEPVARMILRQYESFSAATTDDHVSLGAQILHVCLDFDQLVVRGHSTESAWHWLSSRSGEYNPQVLAPLEDFRFSSVTYRSTVMSLARLEAGMVIDEDIRTNSGLLLVARGHETTAAMLVRLRNFRQSSAIPQTVRVLVLAPGIDSDDAPAAGTSAQSAATSL